MILKLISRYISISTLLICVLLTSSIAAISQKTDCDLIVHNAKVYTVDKDFSMHTAFAIKDGNFIALGNDNDIIGKYSASKTIDAKQKFIYPGFNDGHSHFLGYGLARTKHANLVGTKSMDEVLEILKKHDKKYPGEYLSGRGWDQNDWEVVEFPDNKDLSKLFPNKAVVLRRVDGHAVLVNDYVLQLAGIDANSKIEGGEVLVKDGKATGVLVDNAMDLLDIDRPEYTKEELISALMLAQKDCFEVGLTTVTDAGIHKNNLLLIKELQDESKLKISVYAMLAPTEENFEFFYPQGPLHYPSLTISSIKLYSDGALGSRGALLIEPYSDDPDNYGLQMYPQEYYTEMCQRAYDAGYQVNTHAIGDSGNRIMLKTYAKFLKGKNDRRWRVEHAQIVHLDDINFFKEYSIIPSVQATHCTSDMYWADERLGEERLKTAYAYNDLMNQLGWLVNGTDFPVEGISPLHTYYASVARKDAHGWPEEGFQTENALNREDALRSITIWPAMGSFDEKRKGSIEISKKADFVILDKDIVSIHENKILETKVISTFVDGEKVY